VGKHFRCHRTVQAGTVAPHDVRISLAAGSWFERSKLPMEQIVLLTYFVAYGASYDEIHRECVSLDFDSRARLGSETVADWYFYFREVTERAMLDRWTAAGPMGGPGFIVEIDESKFGKRKNNVGRVTDGHWVLGLYQRGTAKLRAIVLTQDRSAASLLPLIQRHVLPGTTIMTDEWRAYRGLPALGYTHLRVNHSTNFVDPLTGAHTQNIESQWRPMKKYVCRGGVPNEPHLKQQHIMEYLWRRDVKNAGSDAFVQLVTELLHQFPV
jgi:transposase-like protein